MFKHVYVVNRDSYKLGIDNTVENHSIESVSSYSTLERAINFIKNMKEMCSVAGVKIEFESDKHDFLQLYDPEENKRHEYYISVVDYMG